MNYVFSVRLVLVWLVLIKFNSLNSKGGHYDQRFRKIKKELGEGE